MPQPGAERTDVEPAWPSRLIRPATRLVYLDLNQWISLAKAASGHPDGARFQAALETLRARRTGWTYVIGMPLIIELTGNLRRQQRANLGDVIEEFTGFACLLPLTTLAALEFEAALSRFTSIADRFLPVALLGQGVLQAFGMRGGIRVRDSAGNDVTERARRDAPVGAEEFDRRMAQAVRDLDRGVIRGPSDDHEEHQLRELGWDPRAARKITERRAQQQRDLAAQLTAEPRWRRGRLRDVVAARYLALEIEELRDDALGAQNVQLRDLLQDLESARRFTDSMPTADSWITLATAKHRNVDSTWRPNDILDIDALSVAAPYCDVVVAERHSVHVLRQAGASRRFETKLLTSLDQLAEHLDAAT